MKQELTNEQVFRMAMDILMHLRKRMEDDTTALRMVTQWGKPEDVEQVKNDLARSTVAYNDAMAIFADK